MKFMLQVLVVRLLVRLAVWLGMAATPKVERGRAACPGVVARQSLCRTRALKDPVAPVRHRQGLRQKPRPRISHPGN